ncbi:hypothetical protein [Candidatus Magnetominusculus xianensis]|uniref:Uncharacterized protein n=1 Tax=Candidatus Magnetominusculus xianensis TaxID=1748249 RepID=A0ABR5SFB1_9BACT|nr:hypothetical protein [Candidatus Magnetominusculus xianensis]KWT85896.1 hypothetical protein ASN18_1605 [Candidatus Magnetominusculus xianensis]MBF0403569.1 hypothetical protein [Nitrospirota bacterium]
MFKEYIEDYILKDRKRAVLFFIIISAVFFIDKLTLGPLAAIQLHDIFETDFPRYKPMGELLFRHGPYFWYPNWPGGAPAYAWHHSPLYILNIVAQVVPLWAVYGAMVITMMAAAGYGMYRFLSGYMNVTGWVAAVGGVYFALNMQLSSLFILYTFSYCFPLYFAWSWDTQQKGSLVLKLIGLNLFVALSYPVLTLPYFFILEALIILLLQPEGQNLRLRMLIKTSLVWFGYILVCVPVLYSLYKYIPFSHRTYTYEAVSYLGFLKNLYNGFVGSALQTMTLTPLAGAIAIMDKSLRVRRSLIVIAIVVFLSALFSPAVNIIFRGTLFEKMDLGHITTVFPIVMTMAAVIAIDTVVRDHTLAKRFLIGVAVGAAYTFFAVFIAKAAGTQGVQHLILNVGSAVFISLMVITARNTVVFSFPMLTKNPAFAFLFCCAAGAAVFYFSPRKIGIVDIVSLAPVLVVSVWAFFWYSDKLSGAQKKGQLAGILIITIGVILFFQVRYTRFFGEEYVPYISVFPNVKALEGIKQENSYNQFGPFRLASVDYTTIPHIQSQGFETPDGRGPLFNKYYREFFKVVIAPQLSDPGFLPYFESNWYNLFISNFTSNTLFYPYSFLNIRYIVARGVASQPGGIFTTIYAGSTVEERPGAIGNLMKLYSKKIVVVRFNAAFDRVYLVKNIKTLETDKAVYDTLIQTQGAELVNTVYFSAAESPSPLPDSTDDEQFKKNRITLDRYSPDEISLTLELVTPASVVVSNNYDPSWRAYVDGQDTKIYRANIAFQSIAINNTGSHSVVFKYKDTLQRFTLLLIPVGMLIFNYFILRGRRIFLKS